LYNRIARLRGVEIIEEYRRIFKKIEKKMLRVEGVLEIYNILSLLNI
jgi:hypothetical protein